MSRFTDEYKIKYEGCLKARAETGQIYRETNLEACIRSGRTIC